MSTIETQRTGTCSCCGSALTEAGNCLNVDCAKAAEDATRSASRATRKASAAANSPRAFTRSGRVD